MIFVFNLKFNSDFRILEFIEYIRISISPFNLILAESVILT